MVKHHQVFGCKHRCWSKFTCSLDCKRSFYRAFNAIFGKVGRIASENVIIELLKAKCLPALYYGLEACPVNKSQIRSLDYVLNNTFRKIFATKSSDVATECVLYFGYAVQETLCRRKSNFLMKIKYKITSNLLYHAVLCKKSCQTNLWNFRNWCNNALLESVCFCMLVLCMQFHGSFSFL